MKIGVEVKYLSMFSNNIMRFSFSLTGKMFASFNSAQMVSTFLPFVVPFKPNVVSSNNICSYPVF